MAFGSLLFSLPQSRKTPHMLKTRLRTLIGTEHVYYCHNYAAILESMGYKFLSRKDLSLGQWPWTMVLAVPR